MTLELNEQKAGLDFYTAFGNLMHLNPNASLTLQGRYQTEYENAVIGLLNAFRDNGIAATRLSTQDIADLRHLLSIAIWIRSDQLGHPNTVRMVGAGDVNALIPPIKVNTHGLSIKNCQGDLDHALEWWKRFAEILERHDFKKQHSWLTSDFAEKK